MSEYVAIFEQADDGGWGAYLPDLPGVVALGETHDEEAAGIQQALDAYAEEMRSLGSGLPFRGSSHIPTLMSDERHIRQGHIQRGLHRSGRIISAHRLTGSAAVARVTAGASASVA